MVRTYGAKQKREIRARHERKRVVALPKNNGVPLHDVVIAWGAANTGRWIILEFLEVTDQSLAGGG